MSRYLLHILFVAIAISGFTQSTYQYSWKYYTSGNTGIMGDYCESILLDNSGIPYIGGYTPGWEEGGFSRFIPAENQWTNHSNVDYPVIGSIYDVGSSRISDMVYGPDSVLWMATWRGILKFDPAVGGNSLQFWGAANSLHPGGRTKDLDVAPDGTVWAAILSVVWGFGGVVQFDPATGIWRYWGYGSSANNWPALIGQCDHLSIQPKPAGGYTVWIDGEGWDTMIAFDSDTQQFTQMPQTGAAGEVVALPGNDCIDDEGNLWALRRTTAGGPLSLDYRTPAGSWVVPAQPAQVISDIWAFKAYGSHKALITGVNSEIFQFTGFSWVSKGVWREGAYTSALEIDAAGNLWASGNGGAARRDVVTGAWQRYRITNTSQFDYFIGDISIDNNGNVWMTGNAGPGIGGFQKFDGAHWTGFNEYQYGLGFPFPFPTDNTEAIYVRPSNGQVVVNPMYNYLHAWNGSSYQSLNYPLDRSRDLVEDSQNRLWSLGDYYSLSRYNDASGSWTTVPFIGRGNNLDKDPDLPGTIWACSGSQVMRTDGVNQFSKEVADFAELDPQSDQLTTVVAIPGGKAWVGTNKGLIRLNVNANSYEFFTPAQHGLPGENITPLGVSSDGRLWFTNFGSIDTTRIGLCWFDGIQSGVLPVEQGGLPHAQIPDLEIRELSGKYELWMSCLSRGIAVLTVDPEAVGVKDIQPEGNDVAIQAFPNPASEFVSIHSAGKGLLAGPVHITDLTGKVIRTLNISADNEEAREITWDLKNDRGVRVTDGIYVATAEISGSMCSVTIMIITD
jgi:hypothetical protein